jgi:predicted phosphodiesterase
VIDDVAARLASLEGPPERVRYVAQAPPKGWEPGVRWSVSEGVGTITTDPCADEPSAEIWRELIADWGLDPGELEIVDGSIELIGWDSPVKGTTTGEKIRLKRYRARLRRRGATTADRADVTELVRQAARKRAVTPRSTDTPRAMIANLSDWQVGKGEGDGSGGTVERIVAARDALVDRLRAFRKLGRPVSDLYLVGMGDLVEGCAEHYAAQTYSVDLDRAEQTRVVRRLLLGFVDETLAEVPRIVLAAVPGNHGENRRDGKAFTNPATDNDDLTTVETVGEILAANPDRYGHVSVYVARDYTMALDIHGVTVAFTHGHVQKRSGHAAQVMEDWWKGQVMGRPFDPAHSPADADILVCGHRHHLVVSEATGRTLIQCPAMDPGSHWYTAGTGRHSPSGLLTFGVGREAYGSRGWGDIEVLS